MDEVIKLTACEAADLLRAGEITPTDLVDAAFRRIAATDHDLNAIPTLCINRAYEKAEEIQSENSGACAPLFGLPIAIKDLMAVAGVRTTYGSMIFKDNIPGRSDLLVSRIEDRGGIVIGKSNTPEFGAGSTTFNEIFGTTLNPWNLNLTSGGSSGGAAAALATGQVWLATGSDLGGSIRIPASFCGVVGLRPSPGCVGSGPRTLPFDDLSVEGPLGRTVADAALGLDAMAGHFCEDPLSRQAAGQSYRSAAESPRAPEKIAYIDTFGLVPIDSIVAQVCNTAIDKLIRSGVAIEQIGLDFSSAVEVFAVLRALNFAARLSPLVERHRKLVKPEIVWNVEEGLRLGSKEIAKAIRLRGELFYRVMDLLRYYDLLITPTVAAPPFGANLRYLGEIAGQPLEHYFSWLAQTYAVTLVSCPAMSIPCGFTTEGLPIGMQLLGRPHGESELLSYAAWIESVLDLINALPIDPN